MAVSAYAHAGRAPTSARCRAGRPGPATRRGRSSIRSEQSVRLFGLANEDKATRYHRLRRRASLAGVVLAAILLIVLAVSGGSARLRDVTGSSVVLYTVLLVLFSELVQLPLALYQEIALERRYGLSIQPLRKWWLD